jgi:hypothetical protein
MATNAWSKMNPLRIAYDLLRPYFGDDAGRGTSTVSPVEQRRKVFALNDQWYSNRVYDRLIDHGSLDYVNETLGAAAANDLAGVFNPVERAVELYAENVFNRRFGDLLSQEVGVARSKRAVDPTLLDALEQIASWSNLDIELANYTRTGALQGTVGIRVVAQLGRNYPNDALEDRRVYLEFEHPSQIVAATEDNRGNVTQILTEQLRTEGEIQLTDTPNIDLGLRTYNYRTLLTKGEFKVKRDNTAFDALALKADGQFSEGLPNILQVTPYVLARHRKLQGMFGAWCFWGKEPMMNKVNALAAHIDRQIIRHVNVKTIVAAKGKPPKEFDFSGRSVVFIELGENATPPAFEHLVSNLSLADSIAKLKTNLSELRDAMPELKALDGDYLSGQSGETVAHLQLPAAQRIFAARRMYQDALKRALKMSLSWGVLLGVFKLKMLDGSIVQPTREACDAAFRSGAFDFDFVDTEALPMTSAEQVTTEQSKLDLEQQRAEAQALAGAGVDNMTGDANNPPTGAGTTLDETRQPVA